LVNKFVYVNLGKCGYFIAISKQFQDYSGENQLPKHVTTVHWCPFQLGDVGQAMETLEGSAMLTNQLILFGAK
jgi:hypothetical protein